MKLKTNNAEVDKKELEKTGEEFVSVSKKLNDVMTHGGYEENESFINLPSNEEILKDVKKILHEKIDKNLKYILVIGIGGSSLGAKAVYDAIYGHFDKLNPKRMPKMIFIETNNSEILNNLKKFLNTEIKNSSEIIINIISKSGNTVETIANMEFIVGALADKFDDILDRIVITTDKNSVLWEKAVSKNISLLPIPSNVGGRYSVFSGVGLLPLALAGVDIEKFLEGAREMRDECLNENILNNPAIISAVVLFLNYKKGKVINNNFFFNSELESLGKWYRQLMAESIGKDEKGITPTVSIGSTDLHSIGQLYVGGIKNKVISFIKSRENNGVDIPTGLFPDSESLINGKNSNDILNAIFEGVKTVYSEKGVPFMEIILDDISPKAIGKFMQFKMLEMVYLGALLNVNVFNQPDVETYKEETRRILNKNL